MSQHTQASQSEQLEKKPDDKDQMGAGDFICAVVMPNRDYLVCDNGDFLIQ